MQKTDTIQFNFKKNVLKDVGKYILECAKGKIVLNVGATGGVEYYLPNKKEEWLHYKLSKVSNALHGIDIDLDSIAYAEQHGFPINLGNCEDMKLNEKFDIILLIDVIEHVNAPVIAIKNLMNHLHKDGKLIITTPNLSHFSLFIRALLGKNLSIYYDHVYGFLPEHMLAICNRLGYSLSELYYFTHYDQRTVLLSFKSYLSYIVGKIFPRLNSSFAAVIRHKE